ncbi:MAG: hypothetical protein Q9170_002977 [Blastenia crenularia]
MAFILHFALLLQPLLTLASPLTERACSTISGVTHTFYGYPDNDPPGPGTAYNCGSRNNIAGGSGTYGDPLTFASAPGEFSTCEIIYVPYLKKYARFEDSCAQCRNMMRLTQAVATDYKNGKYHIDLWTGSSTVNGGSNQIACENALTPNAQSIVRQPPSTLAVDSITRVDSQSTPPEGVQTKKVNYDKPETLVEALRGEDALVITISGYAPIQDIEHKLIRAAGEAGVPWILVDVDRAMFSPASLPNEWSPDSAHDGLVRDVPLFGMSVASRKLIEKIGKSSYIAVVTGFWYEFSLANPQNYGFDFVNRTVTFYDEGETKISTSTWPQVGRAVAALLSLPIKSEGSDHEPCLENYKNNVVYINSFTISQKDMLMSALRVTGTEERGWTITKERAQERFSTGVKEIQQGKKEGYSKLAARIFFPDGCGDFEHNRGTLNSFLGLPKEDIDEATRVAIERQRTAGTH